MIFYLEHLLITNSLNPWTLSSPLSFLKSSKLFDPLRVRERESSLCVFILFLLTRPVSREGFPLQILNMFLTLIPNGFFELLYHRYARGP